MIPMNGYNEPYVNESGIIIRQQGEGNAYLIAGIMLLISEKYKEQRPKKCFLHVCLQSQLENLSLTIPRPEHFESFIVFLHVLKAYGSNGAKTKSGSFLTKSLWSGYSPSFPIFGTY